MNTYTGKIIGHNSRRAGTLLSTAILIENKLIENAQLWVALISGHNGKISKVNQQLQAGAIISIKGDSKDQWAMSPDKVIMLGVLEGKPEAEQKEIFGDQKILPWRSFEEFSINVEGTCPPDCLGGIQELGPGR